PLPPARAGGRGVLAMVLWTRPGPFAGQHRFPLLFRAFTVPQDGVSVSAMAAVLSQHSSQDPPSPRPCGGKRPGVRGPWHERRPLWTAFDGRSAACAFQPSTRREPIGYKKSETRVRTERASDVAHRIPLPAPMRTTGDGSRGDDLVDDGAGLGGPHA